MARLVGSIGTQTAGQVKKAALTLFARHGYAAVSMRQLAARVGVQVGALYNHFPTKQELLRQLMTEHMSNLLKTLKENERIELSATERLDNYVRFHVRFHVDRADDVIVAYMELRNLEARNFEEVDTMRQEYENWLRDILAAGQESGEFEIEDVSVAAKAIIAMLTGVNTWYRPEGRLAIEEIASIYANMALTGVSNRRANSKEESRCSAQV